MSLIFDKLFNFYQWFIAYRDKKPLCVPFDRHDFTIINPPYGRFYADPFLIKCQGKNYIFFEDYSFVKQKGVISFIEIAKHSKPADPQIVLERDYHLSYPFLFEWNNEIFMIPETGENNTIELYSAKKFPYNWELKKVLMKDIKAYDTTILFSERKAWMFTNIVERGRPDFTDLWLFYADSIFDDWKAHPRNPIVSDNANARPAGNLFYLNGEIIRPAQNSSTRYGQALVLNKLICLTEQDYKEIKIEQVNPIWYPRNLSCHTYNFNEDFEVIDGQLIKKHILKPYIKLASCFYAKFFKRRWFPEAGGST